MLELWESIDDSGGRVLVLEGGAGSGKSSVLSAVQDETETVCEILAGAQWSREVPYATLGQLRTREPILRPVDGDCQARDRVQIAETLFAELLSESEGESEGEGQGEGVDERASEGKRIIVLDDVHLADPESLQIFSQLGRRLRGTRVLLIIAADPLMSAEVDPDFLRMTRSPVSERVKIADFDRADALELARSLGVYDIGEHGASVLVTQSSGRLRVASEILSLLPDGRWPADPADLPLPESVVREVLDPIGATGSAEVSDVASALAILDGPQDLPRVASVAGLTEPGDAVDQGVAHGIFRERNSAGRLTLGLSRIASARVIIGSMAPSTRRMFHERAADSAYREDERLVHLAAAAAGTDEALSRRLSESAVVAERFGRWADAAQLHFGAARVLSPSSGRDNELLAGIDALASSGQVIEVLPWIDIGKNIAPSTLRDTVLANVAIHRGQAAQADDLLSRAAAVPTDDDGLTAQIALRRTLDSLVRWDGPKVREWANRAMSLGSSDAPANVESHAMRALGFAAQGKIAEAKSDLEDLSDRHLSGAQNQRVRLCVGWVSMLAGDLREAVREFEAAVPTQHERGSLRISLWAHGWLARVQYLLGEWDEGLRTAEIGLRRADEANIALVAPLLNWTAAEIKLWRGHPIDEVMRRGDSGAILSDYLAMQVPARLVRAVAANVRGDHDGRAAALGPLLDVDSWTQDRTSFWPWCTEFVDALITLGHSDQGQRVTADLVANTAEARDHVRGQTALASARICQDNGDIPVAEEHFARALELFIHGQQHTAVAQALLSRGQMLRRANRRREAVESLVRAREFYEGVGATVLVKRCDQELRATGMSWRGMSETDTGRGVVKHSADAQGYVPLTPQEVSVADLVVQGMTNAEVSRKLFIAEKTVQYHLTHIYGKFGIRSRTELATVHLSGDVPSV